jgi:hypothetical protein
MVYRITENELNGQKVFVIEFAHVTPYGVQKAWQPFTVLGHQRKFFNLEEASLFLKRVKGEL